MIQPARTNPVRRFAAFDVEMVVPQPGEQRTGPLLVACAAVWTSDLPKPVLWYGTASQGGKKPHMNRAEVRSFLRYLGELTSRGYTLLSWNSMGFDWDLLATQSLDRRSCRQLALGHIDMLFHVVCVRGHRLSLQRAARGMRVASHHTQIGGTVAQQLWAEGHYVSALGQLSQDVRITLELATKCEKEQELRWESQSGHPASMKLPDGWLTVEEARRLAPPDVAGLQRPVSRVSLVAWMQDNPRRRPRTTVRPAPHARR